MDKREAFSKFISRKEILIVDKVPTARTRLIKILRDLGAGPTSIHTTSSLEEAKKIATRPDIGLVFSEYIIHGGSGFDLFRSVRMERPEDKDLTLVLLTSSVAQSTVARAAEEDIDAFVAKPYTVTSLGDTLIETVVSKINPSKYVVLIEEGKELIKAHKYDDAVAKFNQATKCHPKPSLAYYYLGRVQYLKSLFLEAKTAYRDGLECLNVHYKCLVGLYEIMQEQGKYRQAYEVMKKISVYFPANPDRFANVVRLAIITKNFADMNFYYKIFTDMEERPPEIVNYIGAALVVSGRHYMAKGDRKKALEMFQKVAVSCSEKTKFLKEIITTLIQYNMPEEGQQFLIRFPAGSLESSDYRVSEYLLESAFAEDKSSVVVKGLSLFNQGIKDREGLRILVAAMQSIGLSEDKVALIRREIPA